MQTVLILHNILRWGVLIFGAWAFLGALSGITSKRSYTAGDNKASLFFMIFCDIQLVFGLLLFFLNSWFEKIKVNGMGAVMKNSYDRFFSVEHAAMMLVALVFVHIGRSSTKKAPTSASKHKKTFIFFGLALLIIFISIPWPFRNEIARPLFRWFN